ncbi:ROK family protein [Sporichthya sp.]|uniref:ROK family protein n=1 Tax=Sporichthya sp. TaxID=65475 RepID=UPI00185AA12F|nr:ROK family protein [Sporichthya sp.]MBA3744755.1 ROK family protein [Sporichthya sp.]
MDEPEQPPGEPGGPGERTLTFDVGGTGLKATVLDGTGVPLVDRVRVRTRYPCPPERLIATLLEVSERLPAFDRISVGLPGMIRGGRVLATPHFVTEAGPFTPVRPDLLAAWKDYDAATELHKSFACPVRVVNDAELAGFGVVTGTGFEVLLALGTGLGAAMFDKGRLLPKLELSQAPFRRGESYDEQLGDHARRAVGNVTWTRRFERALARWHAVLWWDRLYVGGGNAKHLVGELGFEHQRVGNDAGVLGGYKLWQYPLD